MLVYRLERNGIGPFVGRAGMRGSTSKKKNKKTRHTYNQIKIRGNIWSDHQRAIKNKDYLFGTTSKELLRAYFSYNLQHFFKQGYRIKAYQVPKKAIIDMGTECAFPVKYHKLGSVQEIEKVVPRLW